MSSTTTPTFAPTHSPGFTSALRGELTLARRRVMVWVSLGVWALCIAVFAYLASYLSTAGAEWYTAEQQDTLVNAMLPQGTSYYVLASLPLYGAPQLAILGAVLGASDYGRGTIRNIASRFPNRTPFITARLANLLIIGALAAVVTLLTSILSSLAVAAFSGRASEFPLPSDLAVALLFIWVVTVTFIALGFAIGTLTRNTLTAVVIAVAWVLGVESLFIGMLAPVIPFLDSAQGFLPVGATSSLAAALIPAGHQTVPALTAATTPGVSVAVLVAWAALASTVAYVLFRRRDLA
ncbi:MAG TPA: hypothetical protein DIW46_09510 [Microbacterium sp.]|uniref:ABC transporter permease n=1 Tax=Microbacterium sp. TaxID=51671 RepID=UPI000ED51C0C|nr:hypothetical protein [Microbacterium sp.]